MENPNNYGRKALLHLVQEKSSQGSLARHRWKTVEQNHLMNNAVSNKGCSTSQPLKTLITVIEIQLARPKGSMYAAFIDICIAFDTVHRQILIKKLRNSFNVQGKLLQVLKAILSTNTINIFDGLRSSPNIRQNRGVISTKWKQ